MANEKRLIDVNAAMNGIIAQLENEWGYDGIREDVQHVLDSTPTADAVEVVHGRWEQIGYDKAMDRITCSCCLEYWNIADNDTESFNFCPNCGAKMDGDGNG